MVEALLVNAGVALGAMLVLWGIAARIGDVSFIDAVWGGAMALLAVVSWFQLDEPGARATLIAGMTLLWGVRLGWHLFVRWRASGEDPRYARILGKARASGHYASAAPANASGPIGAGSGEASTPSCAGRQVTNNSTACGPNTRVSATLA